MYGMANEKRRPRGPRHASTRAADAVGGDHLHRLDRRRARRAWATSRRSPTRPSCCCCSSSSASTSRCSCCAGRPSTTSTSAPGRSLPYLGVADLRGARGPVGRRRSEARPVGRRADRLRADPVGDRARRAMIDGMAWDFSTDPEFQEQLDWMRDLVRDEVWPIETVFDELGEDGFRRAIAPLQERVKERGLWAAHLPPDLGGQGFGQVKLGLMHEILGTTPVRARGVRQRRARQRQQRDPRARGHARTRRSATCTRCSRATCAARSRMTEPDTAGSDPTLLQTTRGARRRRVRHQRPQVVLHQRLGRRLPDRDGGHRPRRAAAPARVDAHRRRRHAGREHRPRRRDDGAPARSTSAATAGTPRSSTRTCACPRTRCSARRARAS